VFGEDTPPYGKIYVEVGGRIVVFNAIAQKSPSSSKVGPRDRGERSRVAA